MQSTKSKGATTQPWGIPTAGEETQRVGAGENGGLVVAVGVIAKERARL